MPSVKHDFNGVRRYRPTGRRRRRPSATGKNGAVPFAWGGRVVYGRADAHGQFPRVTRKGFVQKGPLQKQLMLVPGASISGKTISGRPI